jgi:hypothetical protein
VVKEMKNKKWIRISQENHRRLSELKVHPRQPFDEVVSGLLAKIERESERALAG